MLLYVSALTFSKKHRLICPMSISPFIRYFIIAAAALSLTSCADTQYYTYSGTNVRSGTGGASQSIDGIDFWVEGAPAGKFQIVGIIIDNRRGSLLQMALRNGAIAALAKQHGGNAVMLARDDSQVTGTLSSASSFTNGSSTTTEQATVTPYPSYVSATGSSLTTGSAMTTGTGFTTVLTHRIAKYYVIRYL
jgi:hypothetical protein